MGGTPKCSPNFVIFRAKIAPPQRAEFCEPCFASGTCLPSPVDVPARAVTMPPGAPAWRNYMRNHAPLFRILGGLPLLALCALRLLQPPRALPGGDPASFTNLTAYRTETNLEIRFPLRGKDAYAHANRPKLLHRRDQLSAPVRRATSTRNWLRAKSAVTNNAGWPSQSATMETVVQRIFAGLRWPSRSTACCCWPRTRRSSSSGTKRANSAR